MTKTHSWKANCRLDIINLKQQNKLKSKLTSCAFESNIHSHEMLSVKIYLQILHLKFKLQIYRIKSIQSVRLLLPHPVYYSGVLYPNYCSPPDAREPERPIDFDRWSMYSVLMCIDVHVFCPSRKFPMFNFILTKSHHQSSLYSSSSKSTSTHSNHQIDLVIWFYTKLTKNTEISWAWAIPLHRLQFFTRHDSFICMVLLSCWRGYMNLMLWGILPAVSLAVEIGNNCSLSSVPHAYLAMRLQSPPPTMAAAPL